MPKKPQPIETKTGVCQLEECGKTFTYQALGKYRRIERKFCCNRHSTMHQANKIYKLVKAERDRTSAGAL